MNWNPITAAVEAVGGIVTKYFPDELTRKKVEAEIYAQTAGLQLQHDKVMQAQEEEVSKRWQADMASDSWLAKNTRPLMLWALFFLTVAEGVCYLVGLGSKLPDTWVGLTAQAFMAALGAYFVVRGVEKVAKSKYTS